MTRLALLWACWLTASLATGLGAQGTGAPRGSGSPWTIHYGKWAAAALAVTLTVLGTQEHEKGNDAYNHLLDRCYADNATCVLSPDGTYHDPASEELYQSSLTYDHRARARLIAGQVSLLLCASLFVADLRHRAEGPDNIPLHGMRVVVDPTGGRVGIGMRF
jgi:hypothetical protein